MIEEILDPENLAQAWTTQRGSAIVDAKPLSDSPRQRDKRVKANKGAPGIDGMTVADFPAFAREHWPRIASAIREGTYRPASVRRVWMILPAAGSAEVASLPECRWSGWAVRNPMGPSARWGFRRCWIG